MRRNKKRIIKETISFVSALSFVASSNLYGISVIADTQVEPEVTITDAKNNIPDEPEISEQSGSFEEKLTERSISFDVIDSTKAIESIFINNKSGFENVFLKNIHTDNTGDLYHIDVNGEDSNKNIYVDPDAKIESFINSIDINDGKDKIVVFNHTVIYKVDIDEDGAKCTFTAYYRCIVPEDKLSVSVENSENIIKYDGDYYYKYDTELMITPQLGWNYTDRGTEPFKIKSAGYLQFILLSENGDHAVIKINESVPSSKSSWTTVWNTYENLHLRKSYFTINLETDSYVNDCSFINSKLSGSNRYEWAIMKENTDKSLLTFKIPDDRNVYQVTVNGELQNVDNNTIDLSAILSSEVNKEKSINISIMSMPKAYQTTITDEKGHGLGQFVFNIKDGKVNIPYIKTINNEVYRLSCCRYDSNKESDISLDTIIQEISNNQTYKNVDFIEQKQLNIIYTSVDSSDKDKIDRYTIGDEYIEGSIYKDNNEIKYRNKYCYSTLLKRTMIFHTDLLDSRYLFLFNGFDENNDIISSQISGDVIIDQLAYVFEPLKGSITKFISINMLHVEDSELYSDFSEPVNVYYDKHAPNLKLTKIHNNWAGNAVKGVYSFDFTVDDREEAPANASDEIKKIYDEVINAPTENLTEIKSITIGEYKFTNNDGSWEKECLVKEEDGEDQAEEKSEVTLPDYDVKLVCNENGGFTGQIELTADAMKKGVSGLQKEIPVYAEDICGNVSSNLDGDVKDILGDGQTRGGVPVQIDTDEPKLEQMKVSGVKLFGELAVKQSDQKLVVQALPYDITSDIDDSQTRMYYEYDNKQVELQRISDAGDYVLDCSDINNTSGFLKLETCDRSGNKNAFYYCSGATGMRNGESTPVNYTLFIEMAIPVVIDKDQPESGLSVTGTVEYKYPEENDADKCLTYDQPNGKGGYNTWYNRYPDINISSEDVNSICSGLDHISLDINNQHIDIPCEKLNDIILKDGKYYIHFEPKEDKSEFTATLRQDNGDAIELFDGKLMDDGKLEVVITAHDRAGNISAPVKNVAFIDNNQPQSDPKFTVINDPDANIMRFGTFSNSQLKIAVNVSDKRPSSGLSAAVLSFAGKEYKADLDLKMGIAEFTVPDRISNNSIKAEDIKITVYDNVGNKYVSEPLISHEDNGLVIIENKPPYIWDPIIDGENRYVRNGEKWYSSDVTVSYYVDETQSDESGIAVINEWFTKNGVKQSNSILHNPLSEKLLSGRSQTEADYEKAIFEDRIELSTLTDQDGEYTFYVEAYDNANNRSEKAVTVYKDITAPVIKGFKYDNAQKTAPIMFISRVVTEDDLKNVVFGHFLQNETTLTVIADDVDTGNNRKAASSGIKGITCVLFDEESNEVKEITVSEEDLKFDPATSEYSADFQIPQNFKGSFAAYAVDNVNNKSESVMAEGMIIENDLRHSQTSSLDIIIPDTQYTDIDGLPLYKEPFTAGISVTDTFSGLNESEIRTASNDTLQSKKISVDKDGRISGDEKESWSTDSKQRNLITHISRDMFCDKNCNGNSIKLSLKDNCSNTSDSSEKLYSIDSTVPVINVIFSGAAADKQYTNIYNGNRTVTIEITERNFDPSLVTVQGISGLSDWNLVSGTRGTDSAVYRATAELKEDGKYSFTVNCKDRCENSAAEYKSEEFIIDKTAPVMSVTYDNNSVENGRYYNASRTATLRINETNFDASRIKITAVDLLSETNIPVISQWKETNGAYQATVSFKNDGQYSFEVTGSDKAGNEMKEFSDAFFIDCKRPDIVISGMKAANKEDVKPVITFTDKYLDTDTVKITLNGAKRGNNLELKGEFSKTQSGYVFTAENFPKEKDMDDVYTLVAQAADNANNIAREDKVFSVNRFGSNFIFDEATEKIKNRYISKEQALTVYEIDADKHDEEPMILVIKNSEARELKKDKDYTMECTGGDGDWYKYTYTISEENFSEDAAYAVEFYTHDEAGNNNNSVSDEKDAELLFGVDKTPPICTAIDFETNGSYKADVKKAHVIIDDNIIVKGIDVFLNGNKTETKINENNCEFSIPNSKSSQVIKLVVYDMADNSREYVFENILVSTSIARVLIHKTWFKIAIAATAVTGAAAAAYVTSRRKKKMYEILHGRVD